MHLFRTISKCLTTEHWYLLRGTLFLIAWSLCQTTLSSNATKANRTKMDVTNLNEQVVGIVLKANGKSYYISSELCPGGVFLTKPVDENCLCYNGIFQVVRDCCSASNIRISSDALEWKYNFRCGSSQELGEGSKPIRAILPITKPYERDGSVLIARSLFGNKTSQWRKYDLQDVIVKNQGLVSMNGVNSFEIVNIKPLGRQVRVGIGKDSDIVICYSGWVTENYQNLRIVATNAGHTDDCCYNVTKENTPGRISSCAQGSITTEIITVESADLESETCDADVPGLKHTLKKRQNTDYMSKMDNLVSWDTMIDPIQNNINYESTHYRADYDPILIKRDAAIAALENAVDPSTKNYRDEIGANSVVLARHKGISNASPGEQSTAINEFIAILRNDPNVQLREPETIGFRLLKRAVDIFEKTVPNDIFPHVMAKTAFEIFYFLYEELTPIISFPPTMFQKTMEALDACLAIEQMINFTTTGCPRQISKLALDSFTMQKLETFYSQNPEELNNTLKLLENIEIRKDRRYVVEQYDIFVEINWKVADFIHSLCFEHFSTEFNAHDYYESELEHIFLQPQIQKRWYTNVANLRSVRGLMATNNLKLKMKQLDKIVNVGHLLSRYNGSFWLKRPVRHSQSGLSLDLHPRNTLSQPYPVVGQLYDPRHTMAEKAFSKGDSVSSVALSGRSEAKRLMHLNNDIGRDSKYPYKVPKKLVAGDIIWDGRAICLHAHFSDRANYFGSSKLWGITPPMDTLAKRYSF